MKRDIEKPERAEWFDNCRTAVAVYLTTALPVMIGLLFGLDFLAPRDIRNATPVAQFLMACRGLDGQYYLHIMKEGYSFDPKRPSSVAFFPAYPLLSRGLSELTGLLPETSSLLVTHGALLASFMLLARYARFWWPQASANQCTTLVIAFGLWPAGLFFRMTYSESLFVCALLAFMYAMARACPLMLVALLGGFVTAIRPVGIAVMPAFAWHILTRRGTSMGHRVTYLVLLSPVACWGLLAYMLYLGLAFGNPLAFAQTQAHWNMMAPRADWEDKVWSLLVLEPAWGLYVPGYYRYWGNVDRHLNPLFSMIFWNPILFVAAAVLLLAGGWKRWLSPCEVLLGAALLLIPYVTRANEMSMASHGRFASVVVVDYLVLGRLLAQSSTLARSTTCIASSVLLCIWSALFAGQYLIF